jgi:hypothetical protein
MRRRFHLQRDVDASGVSGTGRVAAGLRLPGGLALLWWSGPYPTVTVHLRGMASIEAIHGHQGSTRIVWED